MNWLQQWAGYMPQMLSGLGVSLFIAGVSIVIGYPLGLLLSVMVQRKNLVIRTLGLAIVEIGRGAPALVILYLVYYGLPKFGIAFESIQAACIALVWNAAAYSSEIIRAGLQSWPVVRPRRPRCWACRPATRSSASSCRKACARRSRA